MKITHAQPLMRGSEGGQVEPTPLLSPAEADAEAAVFGSELVSFNLQAFEDIPPEFLGQPVDSTCTHTICRSSRRRLMSAVPTS